MISPRPALRCLLTLFLTAAFAQAQTPSSPYTGAWRAQIVTTAATSICSGELGWTRTTDVSIEVSGSQANVIVPNGPTYTGTFASDRIVASATFPDGTGTTSETLTLDLTFDPVNGNQLTGGSSWTYTSPQGNCVGATAITGSQRSDLTFYGSGCGPTVPSLGVAFAALGVPTIEFTAGPGPANGVSVWLVGGGGRISFPFPTIGPGCSLLVNPIVAPVRPTNAAGVRELELPIDPSLAGLALQVQAAMFNATVTIGAGAATRAAELVIR